MFATASPLCLSKVLLPTYKCTAHTCSHNYNSRLQARVSMILSSGQR